VFSDPVLIVLVHGYLAPAALLWPMARQLERLGHATSVFGYPSHRGTLEGHAEALRKHLVDTARRTEAMALFGHSLGGLLVHHALAAEPELPVTRRIFAATPHRGCRTARLTARGPLARLLSPLGMAAAGGFRGTAAHPARTGVIIATRDRLVLPEEAELPGAHDRLELPFGHNELLMRPRTARAVARFVDTGWFDPEPDWSGVRP
jgi:pimeloyl-ACP methyl ester carboxylesterase